MDLHNLLNKNNSLEEDKFTKKFYSNIKYPGPDANISYIWPRRVKSYVPKGSFSFLDAGCGAGSHTAGLLDLYPNANGYAIDVSEPSLILAKKLIKAKNFENRVKFINCSYLSPIHKVPELVDLAIAIGTLHHTSNPTLGLQNIVAKVKPGGCVAFMVYGSRGHRRRYEIKEAINELGSSTSRVDLYKAYQNKYEGFLDTTLRILVRRFKNKIRNIFFRLINRKNSGYYHGSVNNIFRADAISSPIDKSFNTGEIHNLINNAGLEVEEMFGMGNINNKNLLPDLWLNEWEKYDYWKKVKLIELLDPEPASWSIIARKPK